MDKFIKIIQKIGILPGLHHSYRVGHLEQNPWELANFAQYLNDNGGIKSYLEVGVSNGGLLKFMSTAFKLDKIYAADIKVPGKLPNGTNFFHGNTRSNEFKQWLSQIGYVDLIFVDADHAYESVANDYERCKEVGHKYMAFHDVCGLRECGGSKKHWKEIENQPQNGYKETRVWISPEQKVDPIGIGLLIK